MRRAVLIVGMCLLPAAGHGETASVASGVKTELAIHSRFGFDCKPAHVVITLLKMPDNGTVMVEAKDYLVPAENKYGVKQPPQCVGKTMRGVALFYQSKPGFVGSDSFRYSRVNADKKDDRFNTEATFTLTVK